MMKPLPRVALLLALLPLVRLAAEPAVIQLSKGGEIRGELLSENADRVVVDLGFTVLQVPRDAVARIDRENPGKAQTDSGYGADLWRDPPEHVSASSVKDMAAQVGEAVVLIRTPGALGSGFVINPAGYVITNNHVVAGENEINITVYEGDGKDMRKVQYDKVRIVAASPENDLALLKIEDAGTRAFKTVPLGDFETLPQGAPVFAVGSPLGLERSVSSGIVSLRNRANEGHIYIQTTTAINQGNSGGPLFNLKGEVVGVNNMKLANLGVEGLGFAIPVDTVKFFLKNRDAFAFDPRNPNAGYRYATPPGAVPVAKPAGKN